MRRRLSAVLCATLWLSGCVRFVEPDDPPGTYADRASTRTLVLSAAGAYRLTEGGRTSEGRWSILPGCAFGISHLSFEPDDGSESFQLGAEEGWFGGVTLYDRGATLERR